MSEKLRDAVEVLAAAARDSGMQHLAMAVRDGPEFLTVKPHEIPVDPLVVLQRIDAVWRWLDLGKLPEEKKAKVEAAIADVVLIAREERALG